jgi:hypothetical protein
MFLPYALPALLNLALVSLIGNHYTRYNLILIGPYAIGTASLLTMRLQRARWRWPFRASASVSPPPSSVASSLD